jgi:DNA-binding GntR family transcriptional regulator
MNVTGLMATLEENLKAQAASLAASDLALFYDLDEALHAAIFSALKAPRALRLLDAARAPLDRPRRIGLPEVGRPEATLDEHRRLVAAIASGDPEFAAAAMRAHLSMVARTVERELADIDPASAAAGG